MLLQWYTENKKLKRESVALRTSCMTSGHTLDSIIDELDGEDAQGQDEMEELRKTVQGGFGKSALCIWDCKNTF